MQQCFSEKAGDQPIGSSASSDEPLWLGGTQGTTALFRLGLNNH